MNLVHAPENFVFRDAIAHKSPSEVREILKSHAFTPHLRAKESTARDQLKANRKSEIWIRRDTHAFWAVRLDAQGHNVASGRSSKGLWAKHHGSRPHYHKDWVQDVDDFEEYTNHALDTAVAYSDAGKPLGTHKQCAKDSLLAALQHIKR